MWTLVIIIFFGTVDVEHVPGFATRELCMAAARQIVLPPREGTRPNRHAICVQTEEE